MHDEYLAFRESAKSHHQVLAWLNLVSNVDLYFLCSWKAGVICKVQDHRTAQAGRHFWKSSTPNPCSGRVSYRRLLRVMSTWVLNISKAADSTTSLGNWWQCLITLTEKKSFFLCWGGISCISVCPIASCPINWAPLRKSWLCLLWSLH